MSRKLIIALLYGGRSGEHEVSLRSGASVLRYLDRGRFDLVPVAIDKEGRWLLHDLAKLERDLPSSLPVNRGAMEVVLSPTPGRHELLPVEGGAPIPIDAVFPVLHGPLYEDGTIQGLFELAEIPYVGCGVLASSVGMDKEASKRLARELGVPVVPWMTLRPGGYRQDPDTAHQAIERTLGFPCFVKPANMGSSVGVTKVKTASELPGAIADAFRYDNKILVEKAIDAREIEVAVLEPLEEGQPPMTSIAGEIQPAHEFYSYQAKYIDENGAALHVPARLTQAQSDAARRIAAEVFTALECEGLARVDLFLDRASGETYFNEVNTLPGFTSISMFPKLWEASGIPYPKQLTHLVDLALRRQQRRAALSREYTA